MNEDTEHLLRTLQGCLAQLQAISPQTTEISDLLADVSANIEDIENGLRLVWS